MTAAAPVVEGAFDPAVSIGRVRHYPQDASHPAVANRRAAKEAEIELDAVLRVARRNYASQSGSESSPISSS